MNDGVMSGFDWFLCNVTKKRRAEAEVAYNDISDSALFCY
jgi:hypothetical protein